MRFIYTIQYYWHRMWQWLLIRPLSWVSIIWEVKNLRRTDLDECIKIELAANLDAGEPISEAMAESAVYGDYIGNIQYPQTWYLVPENRIIEAVVQLSCGITIGHELMDNEFGFDMERRQAYGRCRWCDKAIPMPYEETLLPEMYGDLNSQGYPQNINFNDND